MCNCVLSVRCPSFFLINRWSSVIILPTLTMDFLGKPANFCSFGENKCSSFAILVGICEVIAERITSCLFSLYQLDEIIKAGLCFKPDKSVKGKPIKTTSPLLKSVINRVFFVIPKFKRFFCKFQKVKVFEFNFQKVRQFNE